MKCSINSFGSSSCVVAQFLPWLGHRPSSWIHIIKPSAACLRPFHVDRGPWRSVKGTLADSGKTPGAQQRGVQRSAENMDEATGKWLRLTITFAEVLKGNLNGGKKCTIGFSGKDCIISTEEHKRSWAKCLIPLQQPLILTVHEHTHLQLLIHRPPVKKRKAGPQSKSAQRRGEHQSNTSCASASID